MFGKMMNNYYYGKSGKGDFRKEDLPTTRKELFRQTLRTRFASLIRLNLLYAIIWLPAMIVIYLCFNQIYTLTNNMNLYSVSYNEYLEFAQKNEIEAITSSEYAEKKEQVALATRDYDLYIQVKPNENIEQFNSRTANTQGYSDWIKSIILQYLIYLIPCIAITGPFTAGLSYVTRNWARDEHAFIWNDYKDAIKSNWKIPLVISIITSIIPLIVFEGWNFYGELASGNVIMTIPQVLIPVLGAFWSISVTYMYPMTVTYDLKLRDVLLNGIKFGEFRLPFSVAIRLLHCVPVIIFFIAQLLFGLDMMLALLLLGAYYILIGFSLSRFITASYTNAVFDRFMNSRIEGAKVNQGLQSADDYDDDEEDPGDSDFTVNNNEEPATGKE